MAEENKYQAGKIYKITGQNSLPYYGSTIRELEQRFREHKHQLRDTKKKGKK